MMSIFDSLGNVFALILAGLVAVLAVVTKLWRGEKSKRNEAEQKVEEQAGVIKRERDSRKTADDAQKQADEAEEEAVRKAREGRRDHFEQQ